jgi:hypothetical protein
VTFVDSNVPMYLVGGPHRHKTDAQVLIERLVASGERLVTDAEVLQEILHRYTAIGRVDAISAVLKLTLSIVDEVYPIEKADVLRASEILRSSAGSSARDAIHLAIMERYGLRTVLSFDADFDLWPQVHRVHQL